MKQAKRQQHQAHEALVGHFAHRFKEGVLIVTAALSIFLLLSLFSYHHTDPSWSQTETSSYVANRGGYVGAWLADVFLYVFGYLAYVFPGMLLYAAWLFFKQNHSETEDDIKKPLFLLRSLGFLLILMAGSSLASLHVSPSHFLPFSAGGILGNVIGLNMLNALSSLGTTLILWALFLSGITLFTGVSWLHTADAIGYNIVRLIHVVRGHLHHRRELLQITSEKKAKKAKVEPTWGGEDDDSLRKKPVIAKPELIEASLRAEKEKQTDLFKPISGQNPLIPPLALLDAPDKTLTRGYSYEQLQEMSKEVELHLSDFGVAAQVVAVHPGPVITRFELELAAGTKVSKISGLSKDLARSLSVTSVRIVDVIPGKSSIGLEVPNEERELVQLRAILASRQYDQTRSPLALALGKDIAGHPVIVDLAKMPHLLVAGTTGSGKSVGLNAMLLSLIYKATPDELRLILIDPKMLELSIYEGIPHLLTPVVTDMKEAANALRWCVAEMDRRYRLMASLGVRNIAGYNNRVKEANKKGAPLLDPLWPVAEEGEPSELQELPRIVVLGDEFADMMMVVGKKVEELIARIAQKARAAGIHLVLATQRPSVDVITGLIKANIPTRISYQVSSRIDSRTILDQQGAEQLLGNGDMLYLPPGTSMPVRVHGAFVTDDEVHRVVKYLREQGPPEYLDEITDGSVGGISGIDTDIMLEMDGERDEYYDQAVQLVLETRRASISSIQRRFKIGYNRAACIVETMEAAGVVSPMASNGTREVLVPAPTD